MRPTSDATAALSQAEQLVQAGDFSAAIEILENIWWAFVYDTKLPGTDIHGDDADFSLNFWITPDSANLDPNSGGLVIWDKKNVIPYRENRAVLFEGHLFHKTDDFTFAPGFENRRRSVTILFRRRKGQPRSAVV